MHEMSVAIALLDRVLAEAGRGGLRSVTRVCAEIGALQSIEPDLLADAFLAAAEGGPAQGARLELGVRGAEARCLACGGRFKPHYRDYTCPHCGRAELEILQGKETFLLSLSGESTEAGPTPAA